jgi:SAM-dependent MidA family methyltransferase
MNIQHIIESEILEKGSISYADFMDICLYKYPNSYYRNQNHIGFEGDFYTSPYIHPAFGALIAVKLLQIWNMLEKPNHFYIVEIGSASGNLAKDILDYIISACEEFYNCINYICVDVIPVDKVKLEQHNDKLTFYNIDSLPMDLPQGCIISNELIDAMPIHRVSRKENVLCEEKIYMKNGRLTSVLEQLFDTKISKILLERSIDIKEGQYIEINKNIEEFYYSITKCLLRGFIITIDYGDTEGLLYSIEKRKNGTIRSFKNHTQLPNPLSNPGSQDITSHVNFTQLIEAGEKYGFQLLEYVTQKTFLENLGMNDFLIRLNHSKLDRRSLILNRRRMMNLVDMDGLGNFKVLCQSINIDKNVLHDFDDQRLCTLAQSDLLVPILV